MNKIIRRPFYAEYAWAFDLVIDRPVRKECAAIVAWLVDPNILPGTEILDAGCGTGRYAIELARRGYIVRGVDLSPELIDVATGAVGDSIGSVSFGVGDISQLPSSRYAAILCRGVLNDIIDDAARDAVFTAFAELPEDRDAHESAVSAVSAGGRASGPQRADVFSGGQSSSSITVEGYTPTGANDGESAMDVAGPEYFTTLGVPIVLGRDVEVGDRESALNPVVICAAISVRASSCR